MRVAHAPGMPGTFFPPPRVSDPDMHHGTCLTHVPWWMPGSLTSGFRWSQWRGKRSRHSRRMRNSQFYVSGKRPIGRPLIVSSRAQIICYVIWYPGPISVSTDLNPNCLRDLFVNSKQLWTLYFVQFLIKQRNLAVRISRRKMSYMITW